MAYNRTYYFDFDSYNGYRYRLEFFDQIAGATYYDREGILGKNPVEMSYGSDGSGIYAPIKASTLKIEFIVRDFIDQSYIKQLRTARTERDVYIHLYREWVNGTNDPQYGPLWTGYLLMDLSEDLDEGFPTIVNLKAVDGIASLKYYDFVLPGTAQSPNHLYEGSETYRPTASNAQASSRTFVDWISKALEYAGIATTTEGRIGTPKFDICNEWFNGNMANTTADPLMNTRCRPYQFYKQEEGADGVMKWKAMSCYDVIKHICITWGMRFLQWRGRYIFVQINSYRADETGTTINPTNIRRYSYTMAGVQSTTYNHLGTWWTKYNILLCTGYAITDSGQQRLKGGAYGILPKFKRVSVDYLNVSDINHFTEFPLLEDPWYTSLPPNSTHYKDTSIGVFDNLAPAGVGQTFFNEIWLNFINSSGHPAEMQIDYTMVARLSGAGSWAYHLRYNWTTFVFEWLALSPGVTWQSIGFGGEAQIPQGQSSQNISILGTGLQQFIPFHALPVAYQTADVELGWITKVHYFTTPTSLSTDSHGNVNLIGVSQTANDPESMQVGYTNTIPNSGIGSSVLSPITNGAVGTTNTIVSVVQTGDDSAFHEVKGVLWGDAFSYQSAGAVEVWDGGAWVESGYTGHWGRNTLAGSSAMATLLATEHMGRQFKNVKTYNAKFAQGERGKYYNDGTGSRPNYAGPLSKFSIPGNNTTGVVTADYIMHTGSFNLAKDEWSMKLLEFKDFTLTGTTTNTISLSGNNSGNVGSASTIPGGGIPGTPAVSPGARMSNPNAQGTGILREQGRNLLRTIARMNDSVGPNVGTGSSETITELPIVAIGTALLKVGDRISVKTMLKQNDEDGGTRSGPDKYRQKFQIRTDQGASDTTLEIYEATIYSTIIPGDVISIDEDNLIAQYQRKTEGTIAGFEVDADGLEKGGIEITGFLDSDTMAGTSANSLATSESIKAYVDAQSHATDPEYLMATTTGTATTSTADGEAYAVIIPFDTKAVQSAGGDIFISEIAGLENAIGINSSDGVYEFLWNVATDTAASPNRLLCGIKLQKGYDEEGGGEYIWSDINPTHTYNYNRASPAALSEASSSGSILITHNPETAAAYRLVVWKVESYTAATTGITMTNGTQITIRKIT